MLKRAEYLEIQGGGRKVQSDFFLLLWKPERDAEPAGPRSRVGITVSSKVGKAVVRNRLKRWIREYVRHHKTDVPTGRLVIIAKTSASTPAHDVLDRDLGRLFARAGQR